MAKKTFVLLMIVTFPIGMFVGFVLIATVYYLCIMPIGVLLRTFSGPLSKSVDRNAKSYWIERRTFSRGSVFQTVLS